MAFTQYDQCDYCYNNTIRKEKISVAVDCALKIMMEQCKDSLSGKEIPNRVCSLFVPLLVCEDDADLFVDEVI